MPSTSGPSPTGSPSPSSPYVSLAPGGVPDFHHIYVIVMENRGYSQVIGNTAAPFINSLASQYAVAAQYFAIAHPSQPNYLSMWSGSTQGVTDDGRHDFSSGITLADQLELAGLSWHVAAQNVALPCFNGSASEGGEDGSGAYARRHEPAISWTSVSGNADRCARITDFTHFDPTLGDFWLIVPNLCNDMHDCSIQTGDDFLKAFVPRITDSPEFADSLLVLVWDENDESVGGNQVATIAISPLARAGFRSTTTHTHYSLLRTIESAWSLPCLANACSTNDLRELFR